MTAAAVDTAAHDRLGIDALRPEQRRAIDAAAKGRDTLVVMPTGSGKSAIYQLAGELRRGPTVVVTPLLALQHDQLRSIAESNLSNAAAVNSLLNRKAFERVLDDFTAGRLEYLFVSPEQLANPGVRTALAAGRPSLFVVDEAHCISMWGHDFRPDYLGLGDVADLLGRPPVLALTASAAPPVRDEIAERLRLREPAVVLGSFDRPEIELCVRRFVDADTKERALIADAAQWSSSTIVYAATRATAERLHERLHEAGLDVALYHGALSRAQRESVHRAFLDGSVSTVVATNAFGMGIDKADVRTVAHFDVPGALDAYHQEIGRAGRDGDPARAILYFRAEDLGIQRFFNGHAFDEGALRATLLACARGAAGLAPIAARTGLGRSKVRAALERLDVVGAVRHTRHGWEVGRGDIDQAVAAARAHEEALDRVQQSRVDMMRTYAETTACRRVVLLGYFGEHFTPPCGNCDNCRSTDTGADGGAPFAVGEFVEHSEWGSGTVMIASADRVVVLFAEVGYRTLSTELVVERGLLRGKGRNEVTTTTRASVGR